MQNLLEIQNALRSAPDQQLMALMQGANPAVPQWAVASELNNRREMRMEQTRQQGLGQPTVLAQLTGAASAPTPQTNVAGMPQGVASSMAQSMAPKTNVNQNTGINTVARNANAAAPVATMASGGILKMQDGGDPAEKTYTFVYPEDMNKPSFKIKPSDGIFEEMVKTFRSMGGTIKETNTGRVMRSDTAEKIIQESKIPLLEDVIKQINDGKIITQTDLKAADGSIISKTTPALTGLEEYEASLPISEAMQRKLDVLELARTGAGAADIADSLGMKVIDVIDMGMGALGNGTLRASALAQDIQSWLAGTVIGDAPAAETLAKNATAMREFADGLFYKDDNWMPRASSMIETVFDISNSEDAAAAELAAYQTALDTKTANPELRAKINAMPESSAVFAEGSPTQYTPAGIAALNREYGPADEDMSKMTGQIQGVYDAEQAVKDKARFSGSPYRQGVGNINEYVSGVAALDAADRRYYPEAQDVSSLPSNFPVASPTPAPPQATIAADMATNVKGADTYNEGIATAINDVLREVPSKEVADQTDANSDASLDDKAAIDIDPMTLLPYNNPFAQNPEQGTLKYSPKNLYDTHLESVLRRRAESDARRAEEERIAELEKSAEETKLVYGDTPYTEIPDVSLTPETKGIIGDLAQKDKDKSLAAANPMANRASDSPSSYEQKLLDILAEREKSADQDKWLGLAEMGMRLMASSNPNLLSAIGESGLGAFGSYRKQQAGQDAEELNILSKLADLDMAQQTLQARKEIAALSRNAKNGFTLNTAVNTQQERLKLASDELEAMQDSLGNRLEGIGRAAYATKVKEVAAIRADLEKLYKQGGLGSTRALQTALENVQIDSTT